MYRGDSGGVRRRYFLGDVFVFLRKGIMIEFLFFMFWPFHEFNDGDSRAAGAVETWFFCWAFMIIGIILPALAFLGLLPGVKGAF